MKSTSHCVYRSPFSGARASRLSRTLAALLCTALLAPAWAGGETERSTDRPTDEQVDGQAEVGRLETPSGTKVKPPVPDADSTLPKVALTPKMLYQTLLAEIAGNRGNIPLAAQLYSELAKATRDPRVARRATEVAIYARQPALALESARIWVQADPDAWMGLQTLAGLLLNAQQTDEAMTHLAKLLTLDVQRRAPDDGDASTNVTSATRMAKGSLQATGPGSFAERLDRVYRLLARYSDKAAVVKMVEKLTAPYETLPEAHLTLAQASFDAKDEVRALSEVDRALALRPDWGQAVLFKAQLQQRISSTLAEQTLKAFLEAHPGDNEVRIAYARSLIGDKHYEAARGEFNILLEGNRDNAEVLYAVALLSMQLNDLPVAEKYLKRLLELGIGNPNLLRYYLGQIAEEGKHTEEALDWYAKVTPGEQYLPALSRAASLLAKAGRLDEGRALFQKAGEANPQDRLQLLVAESQLLVNASRITEAYDLLNKQLVDQPDQPELLYETALLAEKLDRLDIMERNLRKLISVKPDDAHAYNALGYSLADHGLRLDEALQLIDKGLALAPDDAFILDSKGWLLYRRGEKAEALEILRKAYGVRPDAEIAAHLGEVLWVSGLHEEATKTWEASVKLNPGNKLLNETIKKFTGTKADANTPAAAIVPVTPATPATPAAE